jgi:hypothetical protein
MARKWQVKSRDRKRDRVLISASQEFHCISDQFYSFDFTVV